MCVKEHSKYFVDKVDISYSALHELLRENTSNLWISLDEFEAFLLEKGALKHSKLESLLLRLGFTINKKDRTGKHNEVDPSQSVAVFGPVAELEFNGGWQYRIKASYDGRNTSWVPEPRIRPISMSIFDNALMQTRAGFQGRFCCILIYISSLFPSI